MRFLQDPFLCAGINDQWHASGGLSVPWPVHRLPISIRLGRLTLKLERGRIKYDALYRKKYPIILGFT